METEELSLSRGCEPATFSISPHALQSPSARTISRTGQRCHLLFISSLIRKKEEVLYIVMLPHLSDIRKIEVQAKDQYKLKVNTKKVSKDQEQHFQELQAFFTVLCLFKDG